uniref:Uncharacterized protein n=1 Tax=Gadus morhua TaxID=8049 RepID=A0A8C5ANT4_GADMO
MGLLSWKVSPRRRRETTAPPCGSRWRMLLCNGTEHRLPSLAVCSEATIAVDLRGEAVSSTCFISPSFNCYNNNNIKCYDRWQKHNLAELCGVFFISFCLIVLIHQWRCTMMTTITLAPLKTLEKKSWKVAQRLLTFFPCSLPSLPLSPSLSISPFTSALTIRRLRFD